MGDGHTTLVVQRILDDLADVRGDTEAGPVISALLGRSSHRLQVLCNSLLYRSDLRLMRPPLGLASAELLGSAVERLLKALREVRPQTVRAFFALAGRHARWKLNGLAFHLDGREITPDVDAVDVATPESGGSSVGKAARRMLDAIEALPDDEQEVVELVRIHGLTHDEAAEVLGVSTKTVQRRLNRALHILAKSLSDLRTP